MSNNQTVLHCVTNEQLISYHVLKKKEITADEHHITSSNWGCYNLTIIQYFKNDA